MNIIETMQDKKLFAKQFAPRSLLTRKLKPDTWASWRAFLSGLFGLAMVEEQRVIFEKHTGRTDRPSGQFREAYLICGRRSGKSLIASLIAVYMACFRDYRAVLAAGETGTVMILAADRKQARTIFNYIGAFLDAPLLKSMVMNRLKESIELNNGVKIEVHTSSYKSVRGTTIIAAICDELAFWQSESSSNPDVAVINALRPAMATIPDALLIGISSPYAKSGQLYAAYRENFGKSTDVLVWQAASLAMNPSLPVSVVEKALLHDRAAAAAEYLAEFRDDIGGFLSVEEIERVIVPGRTHLPAIAGQQYRAFCDPSGGRSDAMVLGIAHGEGERAILDLLREIRAPFSPQEAVREFCILLKSYRCSEVTGDRYSAEWVAEAFEKQGVRYVASEKNRSEIYLEFLPALTSGQIELLDHERMKQQFAGLQRRTTGTGRDSIDHGVGAHDDLSNSAAGALCKVLELNSGGRLGVLELYTSGRAAELAEKPVVAMVRRDGYALLKKAEQKPLCSACKNSNNVAPAAVEGGYLCRQCGSTLDAEGHLISEPTKEIIGMNCCPDAMQAFAETGKIHAQKIGSGSELRCIACGKQTGRDPQVPTNGATWRQVGRRRLSDIGSPFALRSGGYDPLGDKTMNILDSMLGRRGRR